MTLNERHAYHCQHSQAEIFWKVNDSRVVNLVDIPLGISISIDTVPDGGRVYTLTIGGRPEHNRTTFLRVAVLNGVSTDIVTDTVMFLIQG